MRGILSNLASTAAWDCATGGKNTAASRSALGYSQCGKSQICSYVPPCGASVRGLPPTHLPGLDRVAICCYRLTDANGMCWIRPTGSNSGQDLFPTTRGGVLGRRLHQHPFRRMADHRRGQSSVIDDVRDQVGVRGPPAPD